MSLSYSLCVSLSLQSLCVLRFRTQVTVCRYLTPYVSRVVCEATEDATRPGTGRGMGALRIWISHTEVCTGVPKRPEL